MVGVVYNMFARILQRTSGLRRWIRTYVDPIAAMVCIAVLATSAAAGFVIYREAVKELDGIVRTRLMQVAELAALMTDGDAHNTLVQPDQKNNAVYNAIQASYLQILRVNDDLVYIYSVVPCGQKICLVMDAELPRPGENLVPSGVMQVYESPSPTLRKALATRRTTVEAKAYTDEYGTFLSAYAPIKAAAGTRGGVVGVDMSYRQFQTKLERIREVVGFGFGVATVFSVGVGILIALLRRKNVRLQRKYKSIMSNISAVVFECHLDDQMTMIFVNDYISQLTGYPRSDFVNNRVRSFISLIAEEERSGVLSGIRNQLDRLGRFDVECRLMPRARDSDAGVFPKPIWVKISGAWKADQESGLVSIEGYMQNITLRKVVEAKVAESEKTFRQLADSMPNLLWITNVYGDTTFYNKTWLDYTGRTLDEEVDDGWTSNIHPDDRDACLSKFISALATEQAFQCWFRLKGADGTYRWMLSNCTPKFTSSGRCDGFISAATDITERKAFEATLKRANQHLELFFRLTPAAIAVFDANMNYLMVSERWKTDNGLVGQDLVGRCHYDVCPDLPARWKAEHSRCLNGESITNAGDCVILPNGREEWISYALHPWSEDGTVMGIIIFKEFITERKRLDDELRAHREDLEKLVETQTQAIRRESDKNVLLRNIITSANEAHEVREALRGCLDEICHFTGWPAGHCYLLDDSETHLVPIAWSSGADHLHADLVASINAAPIAVGNESGILLQGLHSGETRWESLAAQSARTDLQVYGYHGVVCVPIQADGHRLGVFEFLLKDKPELSVEMSQLLGNIGLQFGRLVERFRQEDRLRLAKDHAEDLARAKSEFLSNMSHELRTPMHAILNYAGMGAKRVSGLPADSDISVKLNKYLGNIQIAGNRLMGLLNNLLDLAKMESGKMAFHPQIHDLRTIVEQTHMELDSLMKAKKLDLVVECSATETRANYDHARMMQVMVNLFSNAIKFSPEGGKLTLRLSSGDPRGLVCSLSDQGRGVPEAELGHIFEAFIQSSDTKSGAGGTGLGLSICRQIVMAHGGDIWAENNPDGGASFAFSLPQTDLPTRAELERLTA